MKNKIFAVTAVLVVIGIIIVAVAGFNVDFCYKHHNLIYIELGQDFNSNDIKAITNEVFPKQKVEIQSSGAYKDNLVINVESVSKEQKETLVNKLNEKYGTEKTTDDLTVKAIPSFKLRDLAKPYLIYMAIAAVAGLVYMLIRYKKVGIKKIISQYVVLTVLAEALFVSVIAITRFPVNRLVMPGAITIFFVIVSFLAYSYENQLKTEKE
jgi:preprotein translocase subunit SecF